MNDSLLEFKDSLSFKCLKNVCLWTLLSNLAVIAVFLAGYGLTILAVIISGDSNIGQGFGWLAIVIPAIIAAILSIIIFAIANSYFAFVLFSEYVKHKQNIPCSIIDKTEQIFNKIIKKDSAKNIIYILSAFAYIFNLFILFINFFAIIIGLISFVVLLIINRNK